MATYKTNAPEYYLANWSDMCGEDVVLHDEEKHMRPAFSQENVRKGPKDRKKFIFTSEGHYDCVQGIHDFGKGGCAIGTATEGGMCRKHTKEYADLELWVRDGVKLRDPGLFAILRKYEFVHTSQISGSVKAGDDELIKRGKAALMHAGHEKAMDVKLAKMEKMAKELERKMDKKLERVSAIAKDAKGTAEDACARASELCGRVAVVERNVQEVENVTVQVAEALVGSGEIQVHVVSECGEVRTESVAAPADQEWVDAEGKVLTKMQVISRRLVDKRNGTTTLWPRGSGPSVKLAEPEESEAEESVDLSGGGEEVR